MNPNRLLIVLALGCLSGSALAEEPATPLEPQERQEIRRELRIEARRLLDAEDPRGSAAARPHGAAEKGAYLGISTSPLPSILRRHLGLAPGMGLVVEFVAEQSPAERAGVKPEDVLQKLDDQLLVNADQLAVLVRSYKAGDEVKLTLIRDGQKKTVAAKLAERELEPLPQGPPMQFWEWNSPALTRPLPQPPRVSPPQYLPYPRPAPSTLRWIEGDRSYTILTTPDGHESVTVKDRNDQTVFEGPIDTREQRDRLPTDIKEKVDKMTKSGLLPQDDPRRGKGPDEKPRPNDSSSDDVRRN